MRIYPAIHYTMGGLWVDYNLMSNVPGLFVLGESNFSDHGANRLGASALMQGLADGYFVAPYTVGNYLAGQTPGDYSVDSPEFTEAAGDVKDRIKRVLSVDGKRTVTSFHRELGLICWDYCGMARTDQSLKKALDLIPALKEEFWENVSVPGGGEELNPELEKALRVADFLEFAELMCYDALVREESCGGHFREEYQTEEGEALRDDQNFSHVSAWEAPGNGGRPTLHKENLEFEEVEFSVRSYK